jgi:hypothetical protein
MHRLHVLLNRLADAGIEFVVIGGFAGTLHGSALITDDVDVCAVLSAESVEKNQIGICRPPSGAPPDAPATVLSR